MLVNKIKDTILELGDRGIEVTSLTHGWRLGPRLAREIEGRFPGKDLLPNRLWGVPYQEDQFIPEYQVRFLDANGNVVAELNG